MENVPSFHGARRLPILAACLLAASCACQDRPVLGPGVPISGNLNLLPSLLPPGATASFPSFDGDSFSAVLPVQSEQQLSPAEALEQVVPLLRAFGFERSLAELRVPEEPVWLPPAELAPLAAEVCREEVLAGHETSREVCATLSGGPPTPRAEAALQDAYGMGFEELREQFERGTIQYSYLQLVDGIPIDGAGVFAFRRDGESLSLVHGTLLNRYVVTNEPRNDLGALLTVAKRSLERRADGEIYVAREREPELVLLPYGARGRVPELRYAWRVLLQSSAGPKSWLAWIDAGSGALLQASEQWSGGTAQAWRWRRDPGISTQAVELEVDSGGTLELDDGAAPVFGRLDVGGDGDFDDGEIGSFGLLKDEPAASVCANGGSSAFRQVHAYSHLFSAWKSITAAGTIPPFPEKPIRIWIDFPDPNDKEGNYAYYDHSILLFIEGTGFLSNQCPDAAKKRLNGAHDSTTLAHEMSHLSVRRLQERRPADWCDPSQQPCSLPHACGRILFHDFADAFANTYASTNCFSGWTDKNATGSDANRYCQAGTSEAGGFPRLADVAVDRFPQHRALSSGNYADGQIASAALWEILQGMRSKDAASGTAQFWQRLQRALWGYAFVQPTCAAYTFGADGRMQSCTACDRDIYRFLQDLERRMVEQWAVEAASPNAPLGSHTVNKVLSGWARAGIFLVPEVCLDQDPSTKDPACPSGTGAGDAVVDVADQEADDPQADGIVYPEADYVKRGGTGPLFRVWTGPGFRLAATGSASAGPSLCASSYQIELSLDPDLKSPQVVKGTATGCYDEEPLPPSVWNQVKGNPGRSTKVFYGVRTWDANGVERFSTLPGAGAFKVPAPFFVVNDSGMP